MSTPIPSLPDLTAELRAILSQPDGALPTDPAALETLCAQLLATLRQIKALQRQLEAPAPPLVQLTVSGVSEADTEFYVRAIDEPWPEHLEALRPLFSAHPGEACSLTFICGTTEVRAERML